MNISILTERIRNEVKKTREDLDLYNPVSMAEARQYIGTKMQTLSNNLEPTLIELNSKGDDWVDTHVMPLITDSKYTLWILIGIFVAGLVLGAIFGG